MTDNIKRVIIWSCIKMSIPIWKHPPLIW